MKKTYLFTLLLLISTNILAEETGLEDGDFAFGAGLGIPYGVLGVNINYKVNDMFDLTAGAGVGYGAGVRIHPLSSQEKFRVTAFYGTNTIIKRSDSDRLERYSGFNIGVGYGSLSDGWDFDLIYIFVSQAAKDRVDELEAQGYRSEGGKPENGIGLSVGYHW